MPVKTNGRVRIIEAFATDFAVAGKSSERVRTTRADLNRYAKRLKGKPLTFQHEHPRVRKDVKQHRTVGNITNAWVDNNDKVCIRVALDEGATGSTVLEGIHDGTLRGMSLGIDIAMKCNADGSNPRYDKELIECSIVGRPEHDTCYISRVSIDGVDRSQEFLRTGYQAAALETTNAVDAAIASMPPDVRTGLEQERAAIDTAPLAEDDVDYAHATSVNSDGSGGHNSQTQEGEVEFQMVSASSRDGDLQTQVALQALSHRLGLASAANVSDLVTPNLSQPALESESPPVVHSQSPLNLANSIPMASNQPPTPVATQPSQQVPPPQTIQPSQQPFQPQPQQPPQQSFQQPQPHHAQQPGNGYGGGNQWTQPPAPYGPPAGNQWNHPQGQTGNQWPQPNYSGNRGGPVPRGWSGRNDDMSRGSAHGFDPRAGEPGHAPPTGPEPTALTAESLREHLAPLIQRLGDMESSKRKRGRDSTATEADARRDVDAGANVDSDALDVDKPADSDSPTLAALQLQMADLASMIKNAHATSASSGAKAGADDVDADVDDADADALEPSGGDDIQPLDPDSDEFRTRETEFKGLKVEVDRLRREERKLQVGLGVMQKNGADQTLLRKMRVQLEQCEMEKKKKAGEYHHLGARLYSRVNVRTGVSTPKDHMDSLMKRSVGQRSDADSMSQTSMLVTAASASMSRHSNNMREASEALEQARALRESARLMMLEKKELAQQQSERSTAYGAVGNLGTTTPRPSQWGTPSEAHGMGHVSQSSSSGSQSHSHNASAYNQGSAHIVLPGSVRPVNSQDKYGVEGNPEILEELRANYPGCDPHTCKPLISEEKLAQLPKTARTGVPLPWVNMSSHSKPGKIDETRKTFRQKRTNLDQIVVDVDMNLGSYGVGAKKNIFSACNPKVLGLLGGDASIFDLNEAPVANFKILRKKNREKRNLSSWKSRKDASDSYVFTRELTPHSRGMAQAY